MKKTKEYGEFFPSRLSLFAYNETVANDHFPLLKEEALKRGFSWKDQEEKNVTIGGEIIGCSHKGECQDNCTIGFKIIQVEKDFYEKMGLSVPTLCPNCRHYARLRQRNPIKLWHRKCQCAGAKSENGVYQNTAKHSHGDGQCLNEFETSYAPDRKEIVYCESCYQQEVV